MAYNATTVRDKTIKLAHSQAGPALVGLFVFLIILYFLDRRPPMILEAPAVTTEAVQPGSRIAIDWTQDWKRLCPGEVTREIVTEHGEVRKFTPFQILPPDQIGVKTVGSAVWIPKTTPDGTAVMTSTIAFRCNFLQTFWPIIVRSPPITIKVATSSR